MTDEPEYGETWVYEGIVGSVPGVELSDRAVVALQFVFFEAAVLVLAAIYGLAWAAVAGTVAVAVAAVGSWLMLRFSRSVRRLPTPEPYRRLLFGSGIEVVLAVLSFVGLVTYLFVHEPRVSETPLLTGLLGPEPPVAATVLALVICWDLVYRIGTGWWASVVGVWRALRYSFDPETTRAYRRADALNVAFAGVQLALVPFVAGRPLLLGALLGHVFAVVLAVSLSRTIQRRSISSI